MISATRPTNLFLQWTLLSISKKLSTKECKQKLKPWITPFIITKISRENDFYKKFMKIRSREIQLQYINWKMKSLLLLARIKKSITKNISINIVKTWKRYGLASKKLSISIKYLYLSRVVSKTKTQYNRSKRNRRSLQ